jgi:hypothetical protein
MRGVRDVLCATPLSEEQAASADVQKLFRDRVEGAQPVLLDIERNWRAASDNRIEKAKALLDRARA